jgi:phage gp16-like protein
MKNTLPKIGNKEKALIHVAKSRLGMSEEDYRAVLASVGVTSSRELNHVQLDEVMKRFEAGGFRPRTPKVARRRKVADPKAPLLRKIGAILADTGLTWEYADGIARNMFGVQCADWCNLEQLWKIAAALSIYQKRRKKKLGPGVRRDDEEGEKHVRSNERGISGADEAHAPRRDAGA